jgi:hypothetical protein
LIFSAFQQARIAGKESGAVLALGRFGEVSRRGKEGLFLEETD